MSALIYGLIEGPTAGLAFFAAVNGLAYVISLFSHDRLLQPAHPARRRARHDRERRRRRRDRRPVPRPRLAAPQISPRGTALGPDLVLRPGKGTRAWEMTAPVRTGRAPSLFPNGPWNSSHRRIPAPVPGAPGWLVRAVPRALSGIPGRCIGDGAGDDRVREGLERFESMVEAFGKGLGELEFAPP